MKFNKTSLENYYDFIETYFPYYINDKVKIRKIKIEMLKNNIKNRVNQKRLNKTN